jgi:hypothetical protein
VAAQSPPQNARHHGTVNVSSWKTSVRWEREIVSSTNKLQSAHALPYHVDAYSGYKANERPVRFHLDEDSYEIESLVDHWHDPKRRVFRGSDNGWKGLPAPLRQARRRMVVAERL